MQQQWYAQPVKKSTDSAVEKGSGIYIYMKRRIYHNVFTLEVMGFNFNYTTNNNCIVFYET